MAIWWNCQSAATQHNTKCVKLYGTEQKIFVLSSRALHISSSCRSADLRIRHANNNDDAERKKSTAACFNLNLCILWVCVSLIWPILFIVILCSFGSVAYFAFEIYGKPVTNFYTCIFTNRGYHHAHTCTTRIHIIYISNWTKRNESGPQKYAKILRKSFQKYLQSFFHGTLLTKFNIFINSIFFLSLSFVSLSSSHFPMNVCCFLSILFFFVELSVYLLTLSFTVFFCWLVCMRICVCAFCFFFFRSVLVYICNDSCSF